MYTEKTKRKVD
jgi:hypothetical protein